MFILEVYLVIFMVSNMENMKYWTDKIDKLSEPLRLYNFTYFSYLKTSISGSHTWLCNHDDWTECFLSEQYYNNIDMLVPSSNGKILWHCLKQEPVFSVLKGQFGMQDGIVLIEKTGDTVERYFFATDQDPVQLYEIYNFYPEILERFVLYLKAEMVNWINDYESRFIINAQEPLSTPHQLTDPDIRNFFDITPIKRYPLGADNNGVYLTPSEAQVYALSREGCCQKTIAKKLGISPLTVRTHSQKIQEKIMQLGGVNRISEVQSGLINARTVLLSD